MDGRMRPYLPELTIRDYNIYQWYLRGVQYQLNTTYGLYSCSLLQHNGVLFALLSDSLAGREATCKKVRLPWTLCWRPMMCQTQGRAKPRPGRAPHFRQPAPHLHRRSPPDSASVRRYRPQLRHSFPRHLQARNCSRQRPFLWSGK